MTGIQIMTLEDIRLAVLMTLSKANVAEASGRLKGPHIEAVCGLLEKAYKELDELTIELNGADD
jgi:hypothetical protein